MRNLNLCEVVQKDFDVDFGESLTLCYHHNERNSCELYTCSHNLIVTNVEDDGRIKWKKDLLEIVLEKSRPVNVTYLSLLNTLCVGLENGEIITLAESGAICELAGVCDNGLLVSFISF